MRLGLGLGLGLQQGGSELRLERAPVMKKRRGIAGGPGVTIEKNLVTAGWLINING